MNWNDDQLKLAATFFNNLAGGVFVSAIIVPGVNNATLPHYAVIGVLGLILAGGLHFVGQFILKGIKA